MTLAIARKLRAARREQPRACRSSSPATRTRTSPLDDRTAFANNYKADLFVSIHANASRASGARGSEVYFLSYQATDEESRRLAMVEGGAGRGGPGVPAPAAATWP